MSLRTKALVLVLLGLGLALGLMQIGARRLVLANFDRLEHEALLRTTDQTRSVVLTMVEEFQLRSADWADWDDMATYLVDGNDGFREANLTADSMASCNWDQVVVLHADGRRVFSAQRDREAGTLSPVSKELDDLVDRKLLNPGTDAVVAGIARIDDKLYLVASRVIRKTDRSVAAAPGRYVTSRLIDPAWIERLRQFTFLDVHFHPLFAPAQSATAERARKALAEGKSSIAFERGDSHYEGFTRFADLEGGPLFDLEISVPRHLRGAATQMSEALIQYGLLTAVVLALVSMMWVGRGLLRPLARLLEGVTRFQAGERVVVPVKGQDELARLTAAFNGMVQVIGEREDALRLVMDATGDGLAVIDFQGRVDDQVSALARERFGAPAGRILWDWLPVDERFRTNFQVNLAQVADGFLPFEAAVDQLPRRFQDGETIYRLEYRGVWREERLQGLLVIINDATEHLSAERAEQESRELESVVRNALRDKHAIPTFLEENQALIGSLNEPLPIVELKRVLHTLKGNTLLFGLESVAHAAHQAEDAVLADAEIEPAVARVKQAWDSAQQRILTVFGNRQDQNVELEEREYERFLTAMMERNADGQLLDIVRSWKHAPAGVVLRRFSRQIEVLARRLGKEVTVEIHDPGCRLPRSDLGQFFSSLVHVVRNAVDHGIEPAAERLGKGKSAEGHIELSVRTVGQDFCLEIKDDGRGINWEAVRLKAESATLPAENTRDLEAALFADGLSTRDEVSEISGRGVGLGAVREVCRRLGGDVHIESHAGLGTTFRFRFPKELVDRDLAERVATLPATNLTWPAAAAGA
ncbi:MAG: Hpt domain-containing protein [Deltaproteobacteria bacterium]|nr:Hpt domain-containing protein [Deltaproteobacteria bacterium]